VVEEVLSPATVAAVDALAARTRVSRFVVLLAQFAGAVAELTGRRDFGIGVPVAHRDRPELEHVVGCHMDMMCLRIRAAALDAGPSGVVETGRIVRQALSSQDVPFSEQVALSGPQAPDRPALFQILFALQDNKKPTLDITGARSRFHRQHYLDLPLELHAELWPHDGGGLWLTLYHQQEVVDGTTARRLAAMFTRRLHLIAADREAD
jgi:non-ribosomal peptide synthetase component F